MPSHPSPPKALDGHLELGCGEWPAAQFSKVLSGLVIPRPIGWISTVSAAGDRNVAPYAYFNLMGSDPSYLVFASDGVKDTIRNLRQVPEFVANVVTMDLVEKMNLTSAYFPPTEDEYRWVELTPVASAKVRPFRVGEAKAHLECELVQIVSDRQTHIALGRVVHVHLDPSIWKDGRVDPALLNPASRLAMSEYAALGERFHMPRPDWDAIRAKSKQRPGY